MQQLTHYDAVSSTYESGGKDVTPRGLLDLDEDLNARKRDLFSREYMTTKQALPRRIDDVVKRTEGQVSRSPEEDLEGKCSLQAKLGNLRGLRD